MKKAVYGGVAVCVGVVAMVVFCCNRKTGISESGVAGDESASVSVERGRVLPKAKAIPTEAAGARSVVVPVASASKLSGVVDMITGAEESPQHHAVREKAIKQLGRELPDEEIVRILSYMRQHDDPSLELAEYAALRNELANLLRLQRKPVPGLADEFARMYRDEAYDPVWRDYCIQHLGLVKDPDSKDVRDETLRLILSDSRHLASGTALIALTHMPDPPDDMDAATLALAFVSQSETPDSVKATALPIAVNAYPVETARYARPILADTSANMLQKVACIGVLGAVGAPEDRDLLTRLAASHDQRLAKAAKQALNRLEKR